jgi:hypothetical protein
LSWKRRATCGRYAPQPTAHLNFSLGILAHTKTTKSPSREPGISPLIDCNYQQGVEKMLNGTEFPNAILIELEDRRRRVLLRRITKFFLSGERFFSRLPLCEGAEARVQTYYYIITFGGGEHGMRFVPAPQRESDTSHETSPALSVFVGAHCDCPPYLSFLRLLATAGV